MDLSKYRLGLSWGLAALATVAYGVSLSAQPPELGGQVATLLASALLIAFLLNVPVLFTRGDNHLAHFVGLVLGLAFPGSLALSTVLVGVVLGNWLRSSWPASPGYREASSGRRWSHLAFDWGHQCLSLTAGLLGYRALGGDPSVVPMAADTFAAEFGFVATFVVVHSGLLALDLATQSVITRDSFRDNWRSLLTVEALPIPFVVFAASSGGVLNPTAFLAPAALLIIVAIIVNSLGRTTQRLEKNLKELTTLTSVSRAMRTSLDMQALLEIIYLQVAHLIGAPNFYVALTNPDGDAVSYPIAFRNGLREEWPPRPTARRLTDRVIQSRAPLLIPRDLPGALRRMALEPSSIHMATSWLGIPLLSAERAIGCLAIFSTDPAQAFGEDDLNLLTTIGAQASVGIENAQLYGETQRRAAELRTLTEISALMSATLDPERVLELVCSSVIRVVGCEKSAIFLRDQDRNEVWLARAEGLSSAFMQASLTIPLDDPERAKCIITGQPVVVPDVRMAGFSAAAEDLIRAEGFHAFADLPLRAQGEIIGFLSVYYPRLHRFRPSEIELLRTFANQAALAVSNARLYARTDQALEQRLSQLSALEAIGREVSATLELDRLFGIILERAMNSTNATSGRVVLSEAEPDQLVTVARRGLHRGPHPSAVDQAETWDREAAEEAVRTREPVYLTGGRGGSPVVREPNGSGGAAPLSMLSVPILNEGRSLGAISLESILPSAFSREDIQFVTQLAVQASIAISNGRLFERVREGRDRLAAVLNSTREGVLMIDAEGRIALANPQVETLLGLSGDRLVGRQLGQLTSDPAIRIHEKLGFSLEQLEALVGELQAGGIPSINRVAYQVTEPRERFLERTINPVQADQGRVIGWVMVLRDVSEEKGLEEIRENLTSMIVHDLRSPLNTVLGSLSIIEILLKQAPGQDMLKQARDMAVRSCRKLLGLVDSLLDISRMEDETIKLEKKPLSIQTLVDDIFSDLSSQAVELQIGLANEIPADFPPVPVDEETAGRIFTNLLDNALKYTPDGGRVVVQASANGSSEVVFHVLDDGPGIPEDYRERIFDRFVQITGQVGRRKGSGVGLAFCKLAVEAHGGRIWVENRPGGGAAFSFTLPK